MNLRPMRHRPEWVTELDKVFQSPEPELGPLRGAIRTPMPSQQACMQNSTFLPQFQAAKSRPDRNDFCLLRYSGDCVQGSVAPPPPPPAARVHTVRLTTSGL